MKIKKEIYFLSLIFIAFIGVYSDNLFNSEVPNLDNHIILKPLEEVGSFSDYLQLYKDKKIYDVQPLRDLSHLFDIKFYKLTGIYIGVVHNLLIFWITSFLIFKILLLYFDKKKAFSLFLFYIFHPVFSSVIYIETSRKHLLSFLFTVLLIYLFHFYKTLNNRSKVVCCLVYLLACLSQPINIFIPFVLPIILLPLKINFNWYKSILKIFWPYLLLMLVIGLLNLHYYSTVFIDQTGIPKQADFSENRILSIGRMAYQYFIPESYAIFYHEGSIGGIVGLYALVLFLISVWKFGDKKILMRFGIIYLSVIFVLYHKQTNIFYLDTYILTPSLFFLFGLGSLLKKNKLLIIIWMIIPFFIYKTYSEVSLKKDYSSFIMNKFPNEPACGAYEGYMLNLYVKRNFDLLKKTGEQWVQNNCYWINKDNYFNHIYYLSVLIYLNDDMSLEEKKELYKSRKDGGDNIKIFLELINLQKEEVEAADRLYSLLLKFKQQDKTLCFSKENDYIVEEIIRTCHYNIDSCNKLRLFIEQNSCITDKK